MKRILPFFFRNAPLNQSTHAILNKRQRNDPVKSMVWTKHGLRDALNNSSAVHTEIVMGKRPT